MKPTVLYLGPAEMTADVGRYLQDRCAVRHAPDADTADALLPECDAILDAYMRIQLPAERLGRAPRLKLVVTATTGADHIAANALAQRNIPLLTLKDQRAILHNITAAAEHSWLLLLACARQLPSAIDHVRARQWDRNLFPGVMLRGRSIGIIGCGRIGQWMARYAVAFGMRCRGYDPFVSPWPPGIERCALNQLLAAVDFVTVHVPLTDATRQLIGSREFQSMRPGVRFINTSRGEVIDETSLLRELQSGRIAAAGLDVLTGEPDIADHPLVEYARTHANLILTPHIAGFSPDALRGLLEFSCGRILAFFEL